MISTVNSFYVAEVLAILCIFISLIRIIIVLIAHKNIPAIWREVHIAIAIMFLVVTTSIPINGYTFRYESIYLLVTLFIVTVIFAINIAYSMYVPRLQEIDSIVKKKLEYRQLTAETFAKQSKIEYIPEIVYENATIDNEVIKKQYFLKDGKYLMFSPLNTAKGAKPIEWVMENTRREAEEETSDLLLDEILSNEDCFKGITNLGEILGQMIDLYANNLDNEVFISSAGFAIKLEDEVEMPYLGRAKLVLTNKSILNRDVGFSEEEKFEAKKKCINTFLGIYLKPNFGVIFENNKELNEKLRRFNLEVVKRGLRDRSITTTAYRCNQYIQNVALLSNSQNDIIVS